MKIAFFGTSDRSIAILNALKTHYDLALCVTKCDSIVGRKKELKESGVKRWAKANGVALFEIKNLKEDKENLSTTLQNYDITLGVVADFSILIPESVINTIKLGIINIHFSLLPKYRGACPVQFALLNGDTKTGITYLFVTKGLDEGDILHQVEYNLTGTETSGELYRTLFELAGKNLPFVIDSYISQDIKATPQDPKEATYTYSPSHPKNTFIYKEDAKINWTKSPLRIECEIRAFNPWPIAWTTLGDMQKAFNFVYKTDVNPENKVKIYEAALEAGKLVPLKIQLEGGKTIDWKSFINGYVKL